MKLAAIDIGSNAVRLQITNVISYGDNTTFKRLQYIRFPLRLGGDVFSLQKIGEVKTGQFIELMKAFKIMIDLYEVDEYYACATSAVREAENGGELVQKIYEESGLKINIISGEEEAEMINRVIAFQLDEGDYLHIDVGGGSTELNLYKNKIKVAARSFPIGTVRKLALKSKEAAWQALYDWIDSYTSNSDYHITAIGTGGNINKLYELAVGIADKQMSIKQLKATRAMLKELPLEERMYKLQLNADRADVIIPASDIYLNVMKKADANKILVPDVGLKDGIMNYLYEKNRYQKGRFLIKNS
ncbi:phosphatase [Reichenbachiella sp. MALMAid0571]|uniref:Ppx/GppA phosphatase family protein n=1 Tax=Reichenbachiella sp. MALMAid0571 TaxID=3143939 RepID=UPI0032DEA84B